VALAAVGRLGLSIVQAVVNVAVVGFTTIKPVTVLCVTRDECLAVVLIMATVRAGVNTHFIRPIVMWYG